MAALGPVRPGAWPEAGFRCAGPGPVRARGAASPRSGAVPRAGLRRAGGPREEIGLGLHSKPEGAPDALHIHSNHTRSLLGSAERGEREAREVPHRALRAIAQGRRDLTAHRFQVLLGQAFHVQLTGLDPLVQALADRRRLRRPEQEALEDQLEDAPVLRALGKGGGKRLPEVLF